MRPVRSLLVACALPAVLGLASLVAPRPLVLFNTSPSELFGFYLRSAAPPGPGRIVAFRPPAPARAYALAHLPEIGPGGILKHLVGRAGDRVCAEAGELRVNGRRVGAIRAVDRSGRPLPRWRGCVTLAADQYLAFSDRIPNSFDSRYYGPVARSDVIGVFTPLWVWP
jgi:conjugative transfer signal peptidase TraF